MLWHGLRKQEICFSGYNTVQRRACSSASLTKSRCSDRPGTPHSSAVRLTWTSSCAAACSHVEASQQWHEPSLYMPSVAAQSCARRANQDLLKRQQLVDLKATDLTLALALSFANFAVSVRPPRRSQGRS